MVGQTLDDSRQYHSRNTAADFKRATGFNEGSGLVGSELARRLSERARQGVAADPDLQAMAQEHRRPPGLGSHLAYAPLEGREHQAKAMALAAAVPGTLRTCRFVLTDNRLWQGRLLRSCMPKALLH